MALQLSVHLMWVSLNDVPVCMDDSYLDYIILNPASLRALCGACCLHALSSLLPCVWGREMLLCPISHRQNRHESFQPWNLSYSAGSHLLFLLFTHYNRRQRYRGRLWRLQQTTACRPPLPVNGWPDVINQCEKHIISERKCILLHKLWAVYLTIYATDQICPYHSPYYVSMNGQSYKIITLQEMLTFFSVQMTTDRAMDIDFKDYDIKNLFPYYVRTSTYVSTLQKILHESDSRRGKCVKDWTITNIVWRM